MKVTALGRRGIEIKLLLLLLLLSLSLLLGVMVLIAFLACDKSSSFLFSYHKSSFEDN